MSSQKTRFLTKSGDAFAKAMTEMRRTNPNLGMASDSLDRYVEAPAIANAARDAIWAAPNASRYDYFVKRVSRRNELWALWEPEGWLTTTGKDGAERFLVWPDQEFAVRAYEQEGKKLWPSAVVDKIPLDKWLKEYLPKIIEFGDKVWVFPAEKLDGGVVDPKDMERDLRLEISSIEKKAPKH